MYTAMTCFIAQTLVSKNNLYPSTPIFKGDEGFFLADRNLKWKKIKKWRADTCG